MRQRHKFFFGTAIVGAALLLLIPFTAQGATGFASAAFEQQWNSVERTIPNFWGPLATAQNWQTEQYAEGVYNGESNKRLVQYFDKARMEQTNAQRPVTNGLLTVELKSGQLQIGDTSFESRNPSFIGIAGDQDVPGPTYATLNDPSLPEKVAQRSGAVDIAYDVATKKVVTVNPANDPAMAFVTYQADPGGRFGQNIPKAFWDFMQSLPGPGWLTTMGYPISPAFATNVRVNGQENTLVFVQAFERRVLTYTQTNPAAFKVEFGNIGRHYFRWRSEQSGSTVTPQETPSATATVTATTPAATGTPSVTAEPTTRGNPPTAPAGTATGSPTPNVVPSVRP